MTTIELTNDSFMFDEPIRQEVNGDNSGTERYFYLQDIRNNGRIFYLQSDWFEGDAPKMSAWNKPEMLIRLSDQNRALLDFLLNAATLNAKIPSEYNINSLDDRKLFFNQLPKSKLMYIRLNKNVQCFDKEGKRIQNTDLAYGRYRVIIHPKSIYYGRHGEEPVKASLVLRIAQIQYEEEKTPFLFMNDLNASMTKSDNAPVPMMTSTPKNSTSDAPLPMDEEQLGKKKRTRRPRLQRQDAIQDAEAMKSTTNLNEIFKDLDL